jgi:hypothetical protein
VGPLSKDPAIANLISQISDLDLIPQADEDRLVLFSNRQVAVMQEVVSYLIINGLVGVIFTSVVVMLSSGATHLIPARGLAGIMAALVNPGLCAALPSGRF